MLKGIIQQTKRALGLTQDSPILGSIELWGTSMIPRGFVPCEGQKMNIKGNEALFSILGTTHGGDGVTNFILPDYRPRDAKGKVLPWSPLEAPITLICISGLYPSWSY